MSRNSDILYMITLSLLITACGESVESTESEKDELNNSVFSPDNEIPKLEDAVALVIDSEPFAIPQLENKVEYNQDSLLVYELRTGKGGPTETWYTYNINKRLIKSIRLAPGPRCVQISYSYDKKGRELTKEEIDLDIMSRMDFFYSGGLLTKTIEESGVMETSIYTKLFHYDSGKELIAVDHFDGYTGDTMNFSHQSSRQKAANVRETILLSESGASVYKTSMIFGGGRIFADKGGLIGLEALDPLGRRSINFGFYEAVFRTTELGYYENGYVKSKINHYVGIVIEDTDSLLLNEAEDTIRYVQHYYDQPVNFKEFTYNADMLPTLIIAQNEVGVTLELRTYDENGKLENTVKYSTEFEELKFRLAKKEIQELKDKVLN